MDGTLDANSSISHYRIISKLGAGGMGEVYLARDTGELERAVALKFLPAELGSDQKRMQRFVQEAKTVSALNHPNILTVYEFGQADSARFIVTEYVDGVTLREYMRERRLKLHDVLDVATQIAAALNAAHEAGVVHRDIKPENVMVRRDHIVKLLDFGLAKPTTEETADGVPVDSEAGTKVLINTEPGIVMGTASYMSPEQSQGSGRVDHRTDVWSLGAVLYEMIAGRVPFEGKDIHRQIIAIQESDPSPLSRFAEGVPERLEEIVGKALAKDPDERYQTAKDLLIDLRNLKRRLDVDAEIERSVAPELRGATGGSSGDARGSQSTASGARQSAARTAAVGQPRPTSSAEYVVTHIKRHKLGAVIALAALALPLAAASYLYFVRTKSAAIDSIAVLPFENGSDNPELEYLSDGVSETLIDRLSQLPQLKVIARNSSFKFRGKELDLKDVASKLGVRALITGKVTKVGDELSIRVEMIDALEDRQIWSEQYNRKAADIFAVQKEIAQEATDNLRLKLTGAQEQQLTRTGTTNPQAYELWLKGRFYRNKPIQEETHKAIECLEQAIAADPSYALAYADLAEMYRINYNNSILEPKEFAPKADAAAQKAVELDDTLAEAHMVRGNLKMNAWDWKGAEQETRRAIDLNPNLGNAHDAYAEYLSLVGRHDEAIAEAKRARELDPLYLRIHRNLGAKFLNARRYEEAIEALVKALELDPKYDGAHVYLGYTYAAMGKYREAIAEYEEVRRDGAVLSPSTQIYLGAAYAGAGEVAEARAVLKRLQESGKYYSPAEMAILFVALGEREQAFALLEKAYAEHDLQLKYLKTEAGYDPIRTDPRFVDLMSRVGLSQ